MWLKCDAGQLPPTTLHYGARWPCHSPPVIIYSCVPQMWHSSIQAFLCYVCFIHIAWWCWWWREGVTAALTYVGCVSRINSTDKWCTEDRRKRGKKDGEEDLNRWEGRRSALRRGDEGIIYMILRWVVGGGKEEWSNTEGAEERKIQGGNNMESPWIGKVTVYSLATVVTISHWEVMLPASDNAT